MTTTPIYEPIAHISDDYFRWPKAGGSLTSREDAGGHGIIQSRRLAHNTADSNAIRLDRNLPEANGSTSSGDSA